MTAKRDDANLQARREATQPWREKLTQAGYSKTDADSYLKELERLSASDRQKVIAALIGDTDLDASHFLGHRQTKISQNSRGTPAHRVDFIGCKLSRAMASYWRNHKQFKEGKPFLAGLLNRPAPQHPYRNQVVTVPKLLNEKFRLALRLRARRQRVKD